MQTANDVGSLFGGAVLGIVSDYFYQKRAPVAVVSILISCVLVGILTIFFEQMNFATIATIYFFVGLLLGGVHHLIVVTASADVG